MTRTVLIAHRVSVGLMAVGVLVATVDGFAQSYAGLYHWALEHGLTGWKAMTFPLLVDVFIAVGELGLFALALEAHRLTRRGLSWFDAALPFAIASAGWGVSLAFNVGAVAEDLSVRLTAAVPPVASMLGLLVLLRTVHRIVSRNVWSGDQATDEPVTVKVAIDRDDTPDVPEVPEVAAPVGYERWAAMPAALEKAPPTAATDATVPADAPADATPVPESVPAEVPAVPVVPDPARVRATTVFADELKGGKVPSIRRIKSTLRCGQAKATEVRAYLADIATQ